MNALFIFYYYLIDDYVFYDGKSFYGINDNCQKVNMLYSPNLEFICEVYNGQ